MADGPVGVIFNVDEESVINGVDFIFKRFQRWNDPVVAENTDGGRTAVPREGAVIQAISEQTINLLTPKDLKIEGFRGDTSVYGDRTLTYNIPGMLWLTDDDGDTLRSFEGGIADDYVKPAGEVIVDRRGSGTIKGELEVFDSVVGEPLDYIDLEVPHQVNAKVSQSPVAQRGGERKVQIVGRTPKAGRAMLYLEDAGNLAQTLPEVPDEPGTDTIPVPTFDLDPSDDAPTTIATATLTNDTDLEDYGVDGVEWQYAIQDTEPAGDGTPFGPLALTFGVDAIDTPEAPSGSKVWVRARSAVAATGERSDWSAWQSVDLDTEIGDPSIALSLSFSVDEDGVVDVLATTNGTSVKFALAVEGDPEATDAAVRAATADSSAPFQALAIVTLGVGGSRAVSAFAYDDLGNESTKVTIVVTRPAGTTRSRWEIRAQGGSSCLLEDIPSATTEVDTKYRRYVQIGETAGLTGRVVAAGPAGSALAVQYFRTSDSSWRFLNGTNGPQLNLAVAGDGLGATITTEADARGLVLCRLVSLGGDGATDAEFGSVALIGGAALGTAPPAPPEGEAVTYAFSFNIGTGAAGTQVTLTDFPIEPKAVVFANGMRASDGFDNDDSMLCVGLASGPSAQCAFSANCDDGGTTTHCNGHGAAVILLVTASTGALAGVAKLNTFTPDGLVLDIVQQFASDVKVAGWAIGGETLVAGVTSFRNQGSTGSEDIAINAGGAVPEALIFVSALVTGGSLPAAATHSILSIGMALADLTQCLLADGSQSGAIPTETATYLSDTECVGCLNTSMNGLTVRGALTGVDDDEMTINWLAASTQAWHGVLALSGATFQLSAVTLPVTLSTTVDIATPSRARGGFGITRRGPGTVQSGGTPHDGDRFLGVGMFSATDERAAVHHVEQDFQGGRSSGGGFASTAFLISELTASDAAAFDVQAIADDEVTLVVDDAHAVASPARVLLIMD